MDVQEAGVVHTAYPWTAPMETGHGVRGHLVQSSGQGHHEYCVGLAQRWVGLDVGGSDRVVVRDREAEQKPVRPGDPKGRLGARAKGAKPGYGQGKKPTSKAPTKKQVSKKPQKAVRPKSPQDKV